MASAKRLLLQDRFGNDDLRDYIHELRRDGASWTFIAARIQRRTNVEVSRESLRNWYGDKASA